jgi:hypothetical protein
MSSACSSLDLQLKVTFDSYRRGLTQPRAPSLPYPNLSRLLFLETLDRLILKERADLHRLASATNEGLAAARQDQLEIASHHFARAQVHLEAMSKGRRLPWLLGVSTLQPGIAYLNLKMGLPEESRRYLNGAMEADLELERYGLSLMQVRRIQQGHNLVRIDFLMRRRSTAIELAGDLVAYTEGRIDKLPYHRNWRPKDLRNIPSETLRFLIREIIGDAAGRVVTGGSLEEEWRILIFATRLNQNSANTICPQAHHALLAQARLLSGEPENYLLNINHFFEVGIRHCHSLWYAAMVEFCRFCSELDTELSRKIHEVVKRDSLKIKRFPLFLTPFLIGTKQHAGQRLGSLDRHDRI